MSNSRPIRMRVLSTSDLHQSQLHYEELARAVSQHRPHVVALVGDVLNAVGCFGRSELSTPKCAQLLAAIPAEHLIFIRGNHEDENWADFVAAWPHERRELNALYGTACAIGPLVVVGFPCMIGSESHWCTHLAHTGDRMELSPRKHRQPLASDFDTWLPVLMRKIGPAGRALWLMHESPIGLPLAKPQVFNPIWTEAVERFKPLVVASGHDHETPLENGTWHAKLEPTVCVNVGQTPKELHYALLDFDFAETAPSVPLQIRVQAFPWEQTVLIKPGDARSPTG